MADWCPEGWHEQNGADFHAPHARVWREGEDVTDDPDRWPDLYLQPWKLRRSRGHYPHDQIWIDRADEVRAEHAAAQQRMEA